MSLRSAIAATAITAVTAGCASSPPVGVWEHAAPDGYIGYDFRPNGTCLWIGVQKTGDRSGVGLGSWCSYRYNAESEVITIDEFWDNSLVRERVAQPVTLKYDGASRTVVLLNDQGESITLHWTLALAYPQWR